MRETPTALAITLRRHGGAEAVIVWSAIARITAYKQDLFNPQVVVLEVATPDATWEIDASDCGGFEAFSHLLAQRLPGMTPYASWWPAVTDPLGRQEDTVLYRRPGA